MKKYELLKQRWSIWRRNAIVQQNTIDVFSRAAAISGKKMFCFGGWNGSSRFDSVKSFSLINEKWKVEKNLPRKKNGLAEVTVSVSWWDLK